MRQREFSLRGMDFVVADYRPRHNEFERGLKYQLLKKYYDTPVKEYFGYISTGYKGRTIKECRQYAEAHILDWI